MSPRGYPDWTTPVTQITTLGFAGLEELAARLGSIVPWDLEGNIVLMEDFEAELLEWEDASDGAGCSAVRSSRHRYSGDWSVKLYNAGGDSLEALAKRWLHYPGLTKCALFTRVYLDDDSQQVYIALSSWDGSQRLNAVVYYNPKDTLLEIQSDTAAHNLVDDDLALVEDYGAWLPLLLTFDLETGYYDKIYFAGFEYDISDRPLKTFAVEDIYKAKIELASMSYVAGAFSVYFDNVVLAKNVP